MPSRSALNVSLTPELTGLVDACVASGQYRSASEVVREALRLFQDGAGAGLRERNAAFLLRLGDRIAPLADPLDVMATAAHMLGAYLEADRVGYADVAPDGATAAAIDGWRSAGMADASGAWDLNGVSAPLMQKLRRGQTVQFAQLSPRSADDAHAGDTTLFARLGAEAAIIAPLVKDGHLAAMLYVHQAQARDWSEEDVLLVREVGERTWAAAGRARAEAALRESQARFRSIFDSTFQFIGLLTLDGTLLEANRAALEFGGLTLAEAAGSKLWETPWWRGAPDPQACARLQDAVRRAAQGEVVAYDEEVAAAQGRTATVAFSLRPMRDANGRIAYLVPEGRDVSRRNQTLRRLAESEARFRVLADTMPQMVWVSDAAGNNIYCNARMIDFIGQPQGLRGAGWAELVHPDDRAQSLELRRRTLTTGENYEREHRFRCADGSYRWVLARAVPLRDKTGEITQWFGTNTDITDLVQAREIMRQSRDVLESLVEERTRALNDAARELAAEIRRREDMQDQMLQSQKLEALGYLTGGVAHDFANVLTAISGSYALLRRRAGSGDAATIIQHGEQAVERARHLIEQLMSFVRKEKPATKLIYPAPFLAGAENMLCHAVGRSITCVLDAASDTHPVLANPNQLEIALLNLAVNARDAMKEGGTLTISARNLDEASRPPQLAAGAYVAIAVRDTGCGMPADVLARATDSFFTTKPDGKGTGLGLSMVHGFAARLGGYVHIESAQGEGTTVTIILPRALVDSAADGDGAAQPPDPALHGDATILFVDDDDELRQITAVFLRDLGYTVLEAANAETAAALVRTLRRVDLLLTDSELPGSSGSKLAARLRREWPGLPVQFISGLPAGPELAGEAILHKPFALNALGTAILERLGRWSATRGAGDRLLQRLRSPPLRQFYLTWQGARQPGESLPALTTLDPASFGLGPHSFTVAVERGEPPLFRFVSVGAALSARLGRIMDDETILPGGDGSVIGDLATVYRRCLRNAGAVYQGARLDFGEGRPVHLERLVLPVSNDRKTITHLVGIAYFTEPAAQDA